MLRLSLVALGIYLSTLFGFSQSVPDSTSYQKRKLSVEEVNLVSSYYKQDGNNAAVTGGIGSEKLTDFATTIDVKLSRTDSRKRKHVLNAEIGFDVYTSASSDKIDPNTVSSASSGDQRVYPSVTYSIANDTKGTTALINGSVSSEYDYLSFGGSLGWSKLSRDRNRQFGMKALVFLDTWTVILPIELRGLDNNYKGTEPRNSYSASFTLSQVVNQRLQFMVLADLAYQSGQLATLYHRTYFQDGSHSVENLPGTRIKIPVAVRFNYFAGNNVIFRAYYRYYRDDWNLSAHTAELEVPIKLTPFFSFSPFYRYYNQRGVKYFRRYGEHSGQEQYYTSDYDLSTMSSHLTGMGVRFAPPGGIAGITRFNAIELRYGHYSRSTGLSSDIITMLLKYK